MLGRPAAPGQLRPSPGGASGRSVALETDTPTFRFWLRRSGASEHLYALRFEVFDGRGVLRVARPGVLVDPPARESGYEGELTLSQVRSSRFLHITGVDRRRQLFFLSRIPEHAAAFLDGDAWVELMATVDRGAHHLVLRQGEGIVPSPAGSSPPEPVALSARAIDNLPSLPPSALTPLSEDDALWAGGKEQRAEPPAPEPPPSTPPTSLLRYLRRQLSEARRENTVLQARVRWLERRLASLEGAPLAMEADTADEVSEEA